MLCCAVQRLKVQGSKLSIDRPAHINNVRFLENKARFTPCTTVRIDSYNPLSSQGSSQHWFRPSCIRNELPFNNTSLTLTSSQRATSAANTNTSTFTSQSDLITPASSNGLKSVLLNARSSVNKRPQLHSLIQCDQLDLIAITESHLSPDILDTEIVDSSYSIFRRDRNRHGGGVMIIVRNNLPATRRHDLEVDNTELLWIDISLRNKSIFFGVLYRPPTSTDNLTELAMTLNKVSSSNSVILCGDFNTPYVNWNTTSPTSSCKPSAQLCEIVLDSAIEELVTEPTRRGNLLDLVLTNNAEIVDNIQVVEELEGSDHCMVNFCITNLLRHPHSQPVRVYKFKKADFALFSEILSKIPWNCCFLNKSIEEA